MEGLAAVGGIGGVLFGVLGFFVLRLVRQLDDAATRLHQVELWQAEHKSLPKIIESQLEDIREDMRELKELVRTLYRPKTGSSSASHYAVREPPQSPTPMPPRPRDPRRDR